MLTFKAEFTESVLDILLYTESTMAHHGQALRKFFKKKMLRRLENAILHLIVANNRATLLIFLAEFTESVLDILSYLEPTIRPSMIGPEKNFQTGSFLMAGKHYFEIGVCKYSIS